MKVASLILLTIFFVVSNSAFAAEKSKILSQIDATRAAVDALAGKVGENREAASSLEQARMSLKKASEIYGKGRQVLGINIGFGDLKPEAETEISNYLGTADSALATAASRLEIAKAASELEAIDKQLESVKAKVKVFDDRKAELEKLKAEAAKCQAVSKELETLKSEKSSLAMQVELLMAERNKAEKQKSDQADLLPRIEALKVENTKLSNQVEKQSSEIKVLKTQLDEAPKTAVSAPIPEIKPAPVPVPVEKKELSPAKETSPEK